ncbi:hypothetical protein FOB82_04295 [Corynebacterium xerosis]|uniref:Lipoprotein n=1 Tax=Corynebacterium xerosis TaxID=1725 RepID=A0A6B8TLH3_9CORY|nr:hypothetical protein [Corynebacterium xerosis]QGS34282.1 hypothetical protein FOB82_04295 [Corynebacterium xerosis]
MKPRTSRTAPALIALAASALALAACGTDGEGGGDGGEATTSTAAVSVDPDAPELEDREGSYNFLRLDDDGRSHILGHVKVLSADGWLGLADEDITFTALDDGEYRVIARGASGCPGVGEDTDEGLGVIGEIHAADGAAKVWGTPVEADVDSFSTVVLADADDTVLSCGKSVNWTEPTTSSTSTASST